VIAFDPGRYSAAADPEGAPLPLSVGLSGETTSIVGKLTASERLRREKRIENDAASASRLVPEPYRQQRQ